ncbi:flagellar hook-length control protein FliK [Solimonas sp. K1W22B-7]|uniref:flagellar hook-length control protein FliK n=1 Tax=Solimonas sp. K1W22B-7 TaxID=2303331 RepID=UPI000E3352ED|nr:flagellar hook-length control protein FliK [Solimonas sp. K1W22B-7]AXQ28233.1 flagellar hook-length control protein FliK [Solimonas sp. K1W22B-7]
MSPLPAIGSVAAAATPPAASLPALDAESLLLFSLPATVVDETPAAPAAEAPEPPVQDEAAAPPAALVNWLLALVPLPPPPGKLPSTAAANDATVPAAGTDDVSAGVTASLPKPAETPLPLATAEIPVPSVPPALLIPQPPASLPLVVASQASAPAVPSAAVPLAPLALSDPDWSAGLGERVSWATELGLSEATIDLHPEELGPIRIRIETQGQVAEVSFQAAHAATRELLSQSLPQLRELLNGQGLDMARSQVAALPPPRRGDPRSLPADIGNGGPRRRLYRLGLVDDYA